jgi:hypothetical protein
LEKTLEKMREEMIERDRDDKHNVKENAKLREERDRLKETQGTMTKERSELLGRYVSRFSVL